ncbi:NYN domain-containing protein [Adlercreutzia murintestinalis]|uniref:NYN domain-containing protein n=1 Tax=Adlercreutzia murintestinalis TaxID=2941325 RepID=UPI00203E5AA9|nr:NYN domain-containing protein [Adlercreutzia murintestinalis]
MERKPSSDDNRFALLIDADNVSSRYLKSILDELSKYGTVTVKRIYGDWTLTLHSKWKDALLENSLTPIQQFGYTQGKNATDSAMIIDAMDLLYGGNLDGFCIVSSDSDFTRLASRLRESGMYVIGMGEKKTPVPFRRACDVFTNLELLAGNRAKNGGAMRKQDVEQAVVDIITENLNNGKATGLGEVGSRMLKRYPDFDVRNYGTNLLSKLLDEFERVKITKDHSNVTVELVESVDHAEGGREGADEDAAASGEGGRKRSRRRRSRKVAAGSDEASDQHEDAAKAERRAEEKPSAPSPRKQQAGETPQSYIYALVRDAGADGIAMQRISDAVRERFKDFKVRDLGFAQMRQYVASIGDFEMTKEGRQTNVRLAQ